MYIRTVTHACLRNIRNAMQNEKEIFVLKVARGFLTREMDAIKIDEARLIRDRK